MWNAKKKLETNLTALLNTIATNSKTIQTKFWLNQKQISHVIFSEFGSVFSYNRQEIWNGIFHCNYAHFQGIYGIFLILLNLHTNMEKRDLKLIYNKVTNIVLNKWKMHIQVSFMKQRMSWNVTFTSTHIQKDITHVQQCATTVLFLNLHTKLEFFFAWCKINHTTLQNSQGIHILHFQKKKKI